MVELPFDSIKEQLRDIYDSKFFPVYCLGAGTVMVGLTNDVLWFLIGAGGFVVFLIRRR